MKRLAGGWLALLLALAGCYDPNVENGGLQCAAGGVCPSGFHCASDNHCWRDGTGPIGGDDAGGDGGGTDQGGADAGDLSPGVAPAAPTGLVTVPTGPSPNLQPVVKGNAAAGLTVKVYANGGCTGAPAATGTATDFAATGFMITVSANMTSLIAATATDPSNGLTSPCSSPVSYVNDTT